jgi:phosphoribosyl 1,2-cyclic phosphodiesterase
MAMRLKLLGVRGSRPTHKRGLLGYGGNSTSFEFKVDDGDFHLFVDGGSGLVQRGEELAAQSDRRKFHFLVTHTHWDHILGYPMFKPMYDAKNEMTFYASNTTRSNFNDLFFGLQRRANLPIPISELKANVRFEAAAPGTVISIENKVIVETFQLNHQGVTLGYKLTCGKDSGAIITDNAPIEGNYLGEGMAARAKGREAEYEKAFNEGLIKFLTGVHTVVFDTHFTEKFLKADWGHSTPPRALQFCKAAGVRRLVLFHHAPEDLDSLVDDKVQSIFHDACHSGIEVEAAREGDEWELSA